MKKFVWVFVLALAGIVAGAYYLYSRHRTLKAKTNQNAWTRQAPPVTPPALTPQRPSSPVQNSSADIQRTMKTIEEINRINRLNAENRQRQQPSAPRKQ